MSEEPRTSGRDDEVARLQAELEEARARAEEVAAYYRGELEAARRRAEDEAVRIQAGEAGRRKRADEAVARLKGELASARRDAEHAQRRYEELHRHLEEMEQANARDGAREQEAARAAWRTAEEEVERLDGEIAALQRELESERAHRRQQDIERERLVEEHRHTEERWRGLMARLRRGFKASEQRRRALENAVAEAEQRAREVAAADEQAGRRPAFAPVDARVEVDPTKGWGSLTITEGEDLSDEFMLVEADQSIREAADARPGDGQGQGARADVSEEEAETLLMELNVDRRMAERRAEPARAAPTAPADGGASFRPRDPRPVRPAPAPAGPARTPERTGGSLMPWLVAAGVVGVLAVFALVMLL
ncbi:hypothetical protein [Arhodomonas sp. AD133]|uniref:hypothetical protein n=1 Tax=Arhodomonas sp. AD133 TaxID=3415009 RepID=UPI003EBB56FC